MKALAVFGGLAIYKVALAWRGLRAWRSVKRILAGEEAREPHSAEWLWAYVALQVLDEAKAIAMGDHGTSHAHHVVTGLGFAADAGLGNERTRALALATLAGEAVAPVYQLYSFLRAKGLGPDHPLTRACAAAALLLTVAVRLPCNAVVVAVVARDAVATLRGTGKIARGKADQALQPGLLGPAACGAAFMLHLDWVWMTKWALPKLMRGT